MTEQHAEDLYGPNPEGDAPHAPELVTDPADAPSYSGIPTPGRDALNEFLQNAITGQLPVDPTIGEVQTAVANAAAMLWGEGYRKIKLEYRS